MTLPFLPDSLILPETVDAILGFWEGEFPGTVGVFDGFKDFMLKVYVGQTASYKPRMWSASGMRIRTNNAAESLNGRVNRTLRRDGKITCDQFLVAIETQMAIASREIDDGCKSRTKSVSERRNDLLAVELDDFLNGKIGLFAFLEHCSTILTIKRGDAETHLIHRCRRNSRWTMTKCGLTSTAGSFWSRDFTQRKTDRRRRSPRVRDSCHCSELGVSNARPSGQFGRCWRGQRALACAKRSAAELRRA